MGLLDKLQKMLGHGSQTNAGSNVSDQVSASASAFIAASLTIPQLSGGLRDQRERIIAAAYLWGVIDALSQHVRLGMTDSIGIHVALCQEFLADSLEDAGRLAGQSQNSQLAPVMQIGGQAVMRWLSNSDRNAPIALTEILNSARR